MRTVVRYVHQSTGAALKSLLVKSELTRECNVSEAYITVQRYRDNLLQLLKVDLMITDSERRKIMSEIMAVDMWLGEKSKEITVLIPEGFIKE